MNYVFQTNPGPLGSSCTLLSLEYTQTLYVLFVSVENILNQDPHVQAAVMFGRGRFYPGVVIDPKPEFRFDPIDEAALSDFRNLIW